jgi:hypothetical protein
MKSAWMFGALAVLLFSASDAMAKCRRQDMVAVVTGKGHDGRPVIEVVCDPARAAIRRSRPQKYGLERSEGATGDPPKLRGVQTDRVKETSKWRPQPQGGPAKGENPFKAPATDSIKSPENSVLRKGG